MRDGNYWKKRMAALEDHQYQKSVAYYRDVQEQYRKAINEMVIDIERWYQRVADNNGISLAAAKRLLKKNELDEFRWSVEQYIKAGKENAMDQRWMRELENASAKYHISYLQAMRLQARQHAELLATEFEGGITTFLHKSYGDQYYRTAFEIAKGVEVGSDLARLDTHRIELVLKRPWARDGKNFSERIWGNREKLTQRLHEELTQNIIRGAAPDKAIDSLSRAMNVSRQQAGRLIMTESAAVASRARQDCFKELGVEEFEVVVTLDHITCDFCQDMDGKHFPMSDFQIGETAPPFHPNCRCCSAPYFDDDFGKTGERAARDSETGKTYYVPADMTYKEWRDSLVEDKDSNVKVDDYEGLERKIKKKYDEITRIKPSVTLRDLGGEYRNEINSLIESAPLEFKNIIQQNMDNIKFAKLDAVGGNRVNRREGIYINLELDASNPKGKWTSTMHEIGHSIDMRYDRPSHNKTFKNALENDFKVFTEGYSAIYNISMADVYDTIGNFLLNADIEESHVISDLFGGLTNNQCAGNVRHEVSYWKRDHALEREAFAHFFSASVLYNERKLDAIKKIFPTAYREFLKIVGGLQ